MRRVLSLVFFVGLCLAEQEGLHSIDADAKRLVEAARSVADSDNRVLLFTTNNGVQGAAVCLETVHQAGITNALILVRLPHSTARQHPHRTCL